ncbi:hypothetical protein KTT_42470 [Tengunoibacter tsumagoiensis]|uniref:Uncharacterized protein n=2 Tax=Tengunoibacter tsumagoiensis TaxID=2014871 RepID=A0A402A5G8_9CHLR|nr:hypothetical protein KTT_42470 [Tengunoibacter tsumagoiensis]
MKEAMHSGEPIVALDEKKQRRRIATQCSVCTKHIWFDAVSIREAEDVPEPRLSWVLCKTCYQQVVAQMSRSPLRSPFRLRIAIGLVASERWPMAYPTRVRQYISDRRWIVFIATFFLVAMLFHLALIVVVAALH